MAKVDLSNAEELYLMRVAERTGYPIDVLVLMAQKEKIPVTSLTIINGNPYITVSGLDRKIRNKAEEENLTLKEVRVDLLEKASKDNSYTAHAKSTIVYFDKISYMKAVQSLGHPSLEILKELRETFSEYFEDEGWASPLDCSSIAYSRDKNDNPQDILVSVVNMMACRRASSRAKRQATGCGLTSLDEIPVTAEVSDAIMSQRNATEDEIKKINELKLKVKASIRKLVDKELKTGLTEDRAMKIISRLSTIISTENKEE